MSCNECEYRPKTYIDFCLSKFIPDKICPDAYTEKSHLCGKYNKEDKVESEVTSYDILGISKNNGC